jgi:hypothetical protein
MRTPISRGRVRASSMGPNFWRTSFTPIVSTGPGRRGRSVGCRVMGYRERKIERDDGVQPSIGRDGWEGLLAMRHRLFLWRAERRE